MKVMFLVFHSLAVHSGISKKILAQIEGFRQNGADVAFCRLVVDEDGIKRRVVDDKTICSFGRGLWAKLRKRLDYSDIVRAAVEGDFDLVYIRYDINADPFTVRLMKQLLANIPSLTIVPVSEWLGGNIRQSHLKDRDIQVIHNGIDIRTFSPQPVNAYERYGIDKNKKIVLGVAALWDTRKGLNDFYELAKRLPADDYAIVIVGQRTEDIKSLENACQMVFVDRTQNALELAQLYSSASVFVNPTYQDNYPTTNLESIACGTPVITYRTGGSPEAVDDKTGIVVEQGDVDALADAICKMKESPLSSTDCRKRAEEHFDKDKCFEKYIDLYNDLNKKI